MAIIIPQIALSQSIWGSRIFAPESLPRYFIHALVNTAPDTSMDAQANHGSPLGVVEEIGPNNIIVMEFVSYNQHWA